MTKIKGYIILAFIVITSLFIVCIFEIKDQYDKELTKLRLNNKKINHELKRVKKDNKMSALAIESLLEEVQGKRAVECDCDCEWLRNFYDEFHKEVGANE